MGLSAFKSSFALGCCIVAQAGFAMPQAAPITTPPAAAPVTTTTAQPPIVAAPVAPITTTLSLPSNTEVLLSVNEDVTSKRAEVGDKFNLTVVHDVVHQGFVVIPKGSRAVGEIIWRTGKGAFGKSGKIEIEIKYVEVGGRTIPLEGKFRQEGEGNTVATVAAVALVWVAAPFITGKTGRIPAGRELTVRTKDATPFSVATAPVASTSVVATPVVPVQVPAPVPAVAGPTPTTVKQ